MSPAMINRGISFCSGYHHLFSNRIPWKSNNNPAINSWRDLEQGYLLIGE
jgi:hypothetical protein